MPKSGLPAPLATIPTHQPQPQCQTELDEDPRHQMQPNEDGDSMQDEQYNSSNTEDRGNYMQEDFPVSEDQFVPSYDKSQWQESLDVDNIDDIYASPRLDRQMDGYKDNNSQPPQIGDLHPEDINENSPSEDEAAAGRALRREEVIFGNAGSNGDANDTRDVLNDHRARNRPNKPPNEQQLLNAAKHQLQGPNNSSTHMSDVEAEGDTGDEEEGTGYYPDCWREAIDRAKEKFRCFTMLYNLFPGHDDHLRDAAMILSKIVAEEKSEGKMFHPDYEQNQDMNIVVKAATYRRKLKDLCEKVFLRFYGEALGLNEYEIENPILAPPTAQIFSRRRDRKRLCIHAVNRAGDFSTIGLKAIGESQEGEIWQHKWIPRVSTGEREINLHWLEQLP
ncbi:hypothetical protein BYT27DRAFT_7259532 [Phlegmacium glaucopus]|nr:hypothetical protein BYT27DRAFT_7259532 [Phlegmacium glaucopus]